MELLFWSLTGAAIGVYAAQKRGFSTAGGVIGGLLLGPFAFLLFFVTGIVSSNEQQRKCPFCAEWIRPEATVCKHCHKDVPAVGHVGMNVPAQGSSGMSPILKFVLVLAAGFFLLVLLVALFADGASSTSGARYGGPGGFLTPVAPNVTLAEYTRLEAGMTYQQAVSIVGTSGEELSRSDMAGYVTVMYAWKNSDGSNMNAMFQNNSMIQKAQFGLK